MARRRSFGKIRALKNGRYEASYTKPLDMCAKFPDYTVRNPSKNFGTKTEAELWLAEEKRLLDSGIWTPLTDRRAKEQRKAVTFGDYAGEWLGNRRTKGRALAATTLQKDREKLENHLLPFFGNMKMTMIGYADVQRWWDSYDKPTQVRYDAYQLLKGIMNSAATEPLDISGNTLIDKSPCRLQVTKPKKQHVTVNAELPELKQVYEAMPERLALSIWLGGLLGLRVGEVLGLRRCDIDLKNDVLHVTGAVKDVRGEDGKEHPVRGDTKTESSVRDLPIPEALKPLIADHMKRFAANGKNGALFPAPRSGGYMRHNSFNQEWAKARAVVPRLAKGHMRFHDLRHTALERLKESGGSDNLIMAVAGHTDLRTASIYQDQVSQSHSSKIWGEVNDELDNVLGGGTTNDDATATPLEPLKETQPASATPLNSGSGDAIAALAGALEGMALDVRVSVLKGLDEGKRARVLACFSQPVQVETMTKLLNEV